MKPDKNSLLHDLVDPVKDFAEEVHNDTIGDAKRFYSAQARRIKKNAEAARAEAARRREELRREQEEMKKHRRTAMKRAAVVVIGLIVIGVAILSLILNHGI